MMPSRIAPPTSLLCAALFFTSLSCKERREPAAPTFPAGTTRQLVNDAPQGLDIVRGTRRVTLTVDALMRMQEPTGGAVAQTSGGGKNRGRGDGKGGGKGTQRQGGTNTVAPPLVAAPMDVYAVLSGYFPMSSEGERVRMFDAQGKQYETVLLPQKSDEPAWIFEIDRQSREVLVAGPGLASSIQARRIELIASAKIP